MKKIISAVFLFSALPVFAASTCEQRVDKNLNKSTAQKVSLCLTPPEELPASEDATRVIYYNASSAKPKAKDRTQPDENQKPKIYKDQGKPVNKEYVGKRTYPPFVNDVVSSEDEKNADETAMQALAAGRKPSARTDAKPARKVKTEAKPKAVKKVTVQTSAPKTPSVLLDNGDGTPLSEVVQAQALENDPVTQNYTDGGAAPAGFLQDDLMTGESFGYNNTDPALQP